MACYKSANNHTLLLLPTFSSLPINFANRFYVGGLTFEPNITFIQFEYIYSLALLIILPPIDRHDLLREPT